MAVAGLLVQMLPLLAKEVSHTQLRVASPCPRSCPAMGGRPRSRGAPAAAVEGEGVR